MRRTLRPYVGRTIVAAAGESTLRGTLSRVDRAAIVITNAEQDDGTRIDGTVIIPLPTVVQVV